MLPFIKVATGDDRSMIMNASLKLGVLITYHNEKEMLTQCLESLFSDPNSRPDEVLVYDDVSEYPADKYVPKTSLVRVIRGISNRGPAYGRNELLKASTSDYIHFHDSDDLFMDRWCSNVRQAIQESHADIVFTEITSYKNEKLLCRKVLGLDLLSPDADLLKFCIRKIMLVPAGTYRKETVLKIGGYKESLRQSEDYDFHIRLSRATSSFFAIKEPMVIIRVREDSRSIDLVENYSCVLESVRLFSRELSSKYHKDLSSMALFAGSLLFKMGATDKAREAFKLSRELGPPDYSSQQWMYRWTALLTGPEFAEQLSAYYRRLVPQSIRRFLRKPQ